MSERINFADWRSRLETYLAKKISPEEIAWVQNAYDMNYSVWRAYDLYMEVTGLIPR